MVVIKAMANEREDVMGEALLQAAVRGGAAKVPQPA
jgi:hypothetical protein